MPPRHISEPTLRKPTEFSASGSISAGTPAYDQGLNTGDQIVAIDGYRASAQFMTSYLNEKKPNDKVKLTIFRFDKLRDVDFVLGSDKRQEYDFSVISGATEEQKKLYKQYLNGDL
ncbi:MAG: PDZ domain-containing protein [Acidobacteria bacterium]|nr:PDZ domain-containing protein [Acidobacteriota bacterium]